VCKCVLPPGDNPIAVNKYININIVCNSFWKNTPCLFWLLLLQNLFKICSSASILPNMKKMSTRQHNFQSDTTLLIRFLSYIHFHQKIPPALHCTSYAIKSIYFWCVQNTKLDYSMSWQYTLTKRFVDSIKWNA